ncbi:MAG: glutamate-5-semialdehyde dehydrogenase [Ruminococcaceae bacterium]|nr:glutamate-5-semialdehyde dehydrogenase [Oscillospiraceae bacterium]
MTTIEMLQRAKAASPSLSAATTEEKNNALFKMADALLESTEDILRANEVDIKNAEDKISPVMIDRLRLTKERIEGMAQGIRDVASLPDPVGILLDETARPNGLKITKVSVPLGVIAIIYESRPNVTSDAAALCIKSGNACVLRGGKEAYNSSKAVADAMKAGLKTAGLDDDLLFLVEDTTRASAAELMGAVGLVDALIPRGGAGLIRACIENAKVPCIQTGTGICHVYVDKDADIDMALDIIENAKTSRPSVCNAAECCLVHCDVAGTFLPKMYDRLVKEREKAGMPAVELRGDSETAKIISVTPAGENDYNTEFLDYILAVKVVDSLSDAVAHIRAHSTTHSEAIITDNENSAAKFVAGVDSSSVYVNASTRFTDGGEFGLGCEMGISTQKLHARGPMGLRELTSYKYVIYGNGQIR